jgi:hypothetical protein
MGMAQRLRAVQGQERPAVQCFHVGIVAANELAAVLGPVAPPGVATLARAPHQPGEGGTTVQFADLSRKTAPCLTIVKKAADFPG